MSVNVVSYVPQIEASKHASVHLFLRFMLDGIDRTSIPHTPKRHGDLRLNKLKQVLGNHAVITWRQHYAEYQERKQFRHYTTGGTGPHFARDAVKREAKRTKYYAKQAGLI